MQKIVRPDGSQEVYNYDAKGQLRTVTDSYANGNTINQYYFTYDADGNIISENSFNEPDASEISIDSAEMSYGAANQLTDFNGTPIAYDADGNALSTPLGDAWGNLTYDSLNQLTDVTISGSAVSYGYTYDAEGNRIAKTEKGVTTTYVVDTNSALSQVLMSTENGETTYYVYGLGLISQENSDGYKLYHYDYRGSTTTITNLNGEVTDTLYYDPYGNIVSRTGNTDTPFLYVGQYGVETDDSGLYYMRARYYNPQIQRFINVDPIRDGYNWYGYVEGNGINNVDPFGLLKVSELRAVSNMYNTGAITTEEAAMYILMDDLNATAMSKMQLNSYTPFHEIAQVIAAKEVQQKGYATTLEYKIGSSQKSIDILGYNELSKKIWEIKPLSISKSVYKFNKAKLQVNEYICLTGYLKGEKIKFSSDGYKLFSVKGVNGNYDVRMFLESDPNEPEIIYYRFKSNGKNEIRDLEPMAVRNILHNYDTYIPYKFVESPTEPTGDMIPQPSYNPYPQVSNNSENLGYAIGGIVVAGVAARVVSGIIGGLIGGPVGAAVGFAI